MNSIRSHAGQFSLAAEAIDCAMGRRSWDEFCDSVAHNFSATAFMIYVYDLERQASPLFFGSAMTRNSGARLVDELQSGASVEDSAAYASIARLAPCRIVPEFELLGVAHDHEMPPNDFRDRVLVAGGSGSRSAARLNDIGPWIDVVGLHLPCLGADMTVQIRKEIDAGLQMLSKTLEASRAFDTLKAGFASILGVFDKISFGMAILETDGRVVVANATFRDALRDRDYLTLRGTRVQPTASSVSSAFMAALAAPWNPSIANASEVLALPRRSEGRPAILRTTAVPGSMLGIRNTDLTAVLLLDPENGSPVDVSGIASFGLLTPAELDVCQKLVFGASISNIADERGTKPETVKDQTKKLTAKLGCSSRLELVRLALATASPLRQVREQHIE